jgi:hypothetical protein
MVAERQEIVVTRFDPTSSHREDAAVAQPARAAPFSIADCRSCEPALRGRLEALDDEVRSAVNQLLAEIAREGEDASAFLKAATTVLLSIAAGLMETAAERGGAAIDVESFRDAAEGAAQWAKSHRLRDLLDGEN